MHEPGTVYEVASLYYVHDQTMEAIAGRLGLSRSTVSRMLRQARDTGLVRISLAPAASLPSRLGDDLRAAFGVEPTVVPLRDSAPSAAQLDAVARQAATVLTDLVHDGARIGVAWGTTVGALSNHLPRRPLHGAEIVQLNGAANTTRTGDEHAGEVLLRFGRAFDAHVEHFAVPAFFDYAETRTALWRESAIRRVLDLQAHLDIAVFGVGAFTGPIASRVYAGGYLADDDMVLAQAQGAVGDICTVLLRADGSYADITLNDRASGPTPAQLRTAATRLCVVAGGHRSLATLGALRSGAVTHLVIDEHSAPAVLELAAECPRPAAVRLGGPRRPTAEHEGPAAPRSDRWPAAPGRAARSTVGA